MAQDTKRSGTAQEGPKGAGRTKPEASKNVTGSTKQRTDDQGERGQIRGGSKGDNAGRSTNAAGDAERTVAGNKQGGRSAD